MAQYTSSNPHLGLQLTWNNGRGYHLKFILASKRKRGEHPEEVDDIFIDRVYNRCSVHCTTTELFSLNRRCEQSASEILKRTIVHIGGLRDKIAACLPCLYSAAETIATTDVLLSICNTALENPDYIFPTINTDGELTLEGARHPIMEHVMASNEEFVASNLELCTDGPRMAVITGANAAGKSTLLREVALIVIMGQIGFPVPAKKADLPLMGQILSRIGTEDSIEANCSTFSMEMAEIAHVFDKLKKHEVADNGLCTLALVDELGRGTSVKEGLAIAWACAEGLIMYKSCFTLFVTHFSKLNNLAQQAPLHVKNLQFKADIDETTHTLNNTHTLEELNKSRCLTEKNNYGICVARLVGMPLDVIKDAIILQSKFVAQQAKAATPVESPNKRLPSLKEMLIGIKQVKGELTLTEIKDLMIEVQKSFTAF